MAYCQTCDSNPCYREQGGHCPHPKVDPYQDDDEEDDELAEPEWTGKCFASRHASEFGFTSHPRWKEFSQALRSPVHAHTWFSLSRLTQFISAPDTHVFWVRWRCWVDGSLLPDAYVGSTEDC